MTEAEIKSLTARQRSYFLRGTTLDVNTRIRSLERLREAIINWEPRIHEALKQDLGKSEFEAYMCETGLVLSEITYLLKHIRSFAAEKRVRTPLSQFCARSFTRPSPYGTVLIMSPWNYPFLLSMEPLADAIAAGNTAIVKPSAYSPCTSKVIEGIITECFDPCEAAVVIGGRAENESLLKTHFDYIFFTGSKTAGHQVMKSAAEFLTPVTLELGGKSPCIVDSTADISLAARRIIFGKFINCGQTCVAPDYIYCDISIKDRLIKEMQKQLRKQYGRKPVENRDYGRIVNEKHFDRLIGLIDRNKTVAGGTALRESLKIAPTIMDMVTFDDPVMQEEIFGPILPILTFSSIDEAINQIQSMPHPLALYIFTRDKENARKATSLCGFGGGCINDTLIHLASSELPFGGFGESGMGSYHGKAGFDTFSHYKSIVDKKLHPDLPMRYQPYRKSFEKLIRRFLK